MMEPIKFKFFISKMPDPEILVDIPYFLLVVCPIDGLDVRDNNLLNYFNNISEATGTSVDSR